MRLRAAPLAAALLGTIGLAAPARAQVVDGRVSASLSAGYNQTISDAPFPTAQTQQGPTLSFSPSGILLIDTPRTNHTLTYAFSATLPFNSDIKLVAAPVQYSNRLSYAGKYVIDELNTLSLGGTFSYAPINTLAGAGDPTQTPVEASPVGAAYVLNAGLNEGYNRQISDEWSVTQATSLIFGAPIDVMTVHPKTLAVQLSLGLSKRFRSDTVSLGATGSINYFTVGEGGGGVVLDATTQITDGLTLSWIHPWTEALGMTVSLGVTQIISPDSTTLTVVEPSGSLAFNYSFGISALTAQYAHQAAPNLAAGSVAFSDAVTLRFSLPLGTSGFSASGSGGYSHSEPVGGNGTALPALPTNAIISDVALSYKPSLLPALSASLRGQLQRQVASADPASGLTRLSTSLSLAYSYPSASAAQTLPVMAPALGMTGFTPSDVTGSNRLGGEPEPQPTPQPETAP